MLRNQIRLILQLITLIRNKRQDPSLFVTRLDSVGLHRCGEVWRCYVGRGTLVTAVGAGDGGGHDDFEGARGGIGVVAAQLGEGMGQGGAGEGEEGDARREVEKHFDMATWYGLREEE